MLSLATIDQARAAQAARDERALATIIDETMRLGERGDLPVLARALKTDPERLRRLVMSMRRAAQTQARAESALVRLRATEDTRVEELLAIARLVYGTREPALRAYAERNGLALKTARAHYTRARRRQPLDGRAARGSRGGALTDEHKVWLLRTFRQSTHSTNAVNVKFVHQGFVEQFGNLVSAMTVRRYWRDAQRLYPQIFRTRKQLHHDYRFVIESEYRHPGHVWQADRSTADCFVYHDGRVFRPELLQVVDCASKVVFRGYFPTVRAWDFNSLLACIWFGGFGEEYAHAPQFLYIDNGNVECNSDLMRASDRLGMIVVNAPPGEPAYKGCIERAIRDTHETFERRHTRFYCGPNNRSDHHPEQFALLFPEVSRAVKAIDARNPREREAVAAQHGLPTLTELNRLSLERLMYELTEPHSEHVQRQGSAYLDGRPYPHHTTPRDFFLATVPEERRVRADRDDVVLELMPRESRVVRDGKVTLERNTYSLDGLWELNDERVIVAYNPTNLDQVAILRPRPELGRDRCQYLGRAHRVGRVDPTSPLTIGDVKRVKAAVRASNRATRQLIDVIADERTPVPMAAHAARQLRDGTLAIDAARARMALEAGTIEASASRRGAGGGALALAKPRKVVGTYKRDGVEFPLFADDDDDSSLEQKPTTE